MIIRIKKEMVSKVIIFNGNKILILRRPNEVVTKNSPWTWDLPGGHIDSGEEPLAAAIREVKEETNLDVTSLRYIGKDSNIGKLTYFYKTSEWKGNLKLSSEHTEYRWVGESELSGYEEKIGSMYYKIIIRSL